MSRTTQRFSSGSTWNSLRNTVNIITGKGSSSFTLLFLDEAIGQPKGSHISVEQMKLTIGRGEDCDIRYPSELSMVSRRQCSLENRSGKIFLIPESEAVNPLLVNGVVVDFEYELRNGDEIQISYDGPKLRCNFTESKLAGVGITGRLNTAIEQATRPLKIMIFSLGGILIAALVFLVISIYSGYQSSKKIENLLANLEELQVSRQLVEDELREFSTRSDASTELINNLRTTSYNYEQRIRKLQNQLNEIAGGAKPIKESSSLAINNSAEPFIPNAPFKGSEDINLPKEDLYLITARSITLSRAGKEPVKRDSEALINANLLPYKKEVLWTGLGILTANGELVTARSSIQPWRYDPEISTLFKFLSALEADGEGLNLSVDFEAKPVVGNGQSLRFNLSEVKMRDNIDEKSPISLELNTFGGVSFSTKDLQTPKAREVGSDWAIVKTQISGSKNFANLSTLNKGTSLVFLTADFEETRPSKKTRNLIGTLSS
jgi:hypothetical protein